MRKIVSAHLGNKVFQIEDDAYTYLNRVLSNHRENSSLEVEVAEILDRKLNSMKTVITYPDVVDALYLLGYSIGDIREESRPSREDKKLYRTMEGKMLGGVCTGLSEYFDTDPTLIRILFVAALFIGSFGFWAYMALWIVMPRKAGEFTKSEQRK